MCDTDFDLENFLPYRLHQASETMSQAFRSVYRDEYAMTRTEWRVLAHLGQYGAMTATEIGAAARLHKTKVSRAVRSLEDRRWLARTTAKADRRIQDLELTTSGKKAYRKLGKLAHEYNLQLAQKLGEDRFRQSMEMIEFLTRVNDPK